MLSEREGVVRTVEEASPNGEQERVKVTVRSADDNAPRGGAGPAVGGGQIYVFETDKPEDPFIPGERLTITVERGGLSS